MTKEVEGLPFLNGMHLLPPAKGVCQECARTHEPHLPHDQQTMFYKYKFYGKHGRWPTWKDAIAHCSPEVAATWEKALRERGVWADGASN